MSYWLGVLTLLLNSLYTYNDNNHLSPLLVTGYGDLTYNSKRNLFGAMCQSEKTAYHLFSFNTDSVNAKDVVKLSRRSKWHSQYSRKQGRCYF